MVKEFESFIHDKVQNFFKLNPDEFEVESITLNKYFLAIDLRINKDKINDCKSIVAKLETEIRVTENLNVLVSIEINPKWW